MTETKELGKYEIIPSEKQLKAIADYMVKYKDNTNEVRFTIRQLLEDPIVAPHFGSISYLNGVVTYLSNEGWLDRTFLGRQGTPSHWNVYKLLSNLGNVTTREKAGRTRPKREEYEMKAAVQPEVEIVRKLTQEDNAETVILVGNNNQVLSELKGAMNDIIGYLQTFPAEITGHLNSIANKIEVTDENLIDNLRAQIETLQNEKAALVTKQEDIMKEVDGFMEEIDELTRAQKDWQKKEMDLSAEVQRLNTQLEEVGRNLNYNKHHIYRQRNFILDEVDRMINAPTWTFKQNSVNHRQTIESKLDEIMNEIGIDGNE
jgi:uncharacterized protein YoxC